MDHHTRACAVQVTTVAQLTVLAPAGGAPHDGPLCVVNTHLFFHPRAPHIRTLHTAALLAEASALIERAAPSQQLRGQRPALLFCGDLNSDMNDGISGAPRGCHEPGSPAGCAAADDGGTGRRSGVAQLRQL